MSFGPWNLAAAVAGPSALPAVFPRPAMVVTVYASPVKFPPTVALPFPWKLSCTEAVAAAVTATVTSSATQLGTVVLSTAPHGVL